MLNIEISDGDLAYLLAHLSFDSIFTAHLLTYKAGKIDIYSGVPVIKIIKGS